MKRWMRRELYDKLVVLKRKGKKMGIHWNNEQKKAIETQGKNILVSAAAGSGKTTVLVERIRRLIIDQKVPVDRFLIVTFTKAAASEMKEKIVKALNDASLGENADKEYLLRQLELLPSANISTFNSFALEVLRRYFYLIDIEPGFKVCDESQSNLMKQEALEEVFAESFEEASEPFISFVSKFGSSRDEAPAKNMVLAMYSMIMSLPDPFQWLEEKTEKLNVTKEEFLESEEVQFITEDCRNAFEQMTAGLNRLIDLLSENQCVKLSEKFIPLYERLSKEPFHAYGFEEFAQAVSDFDLPRLSVTKDEKEYLQGIRAEVNAEKDRISQLHKDLQKKYFNGSLDDQILDMQETYDSAKELKRLVILFAEKYRKLKEAKNLLDFSDHEHLALDVLAHEEAAEEYRKKFEYIFIDEYQDSNDVQEALISRICRDNNLFMVGDVKQSIYKFRLAEPEIFMRKYKEYAENTEVNERIDLNCNFRSKGKILAAVNDIFLNRMEGYGEEAKLSKGIEYEGELDRKPELIILNSRMEEGGTLDEEIRNMKKEELEARVAADLIREILGERIHVDEKQGERAITYRDIVVLLRSVKVTAAIYESVFESLGIPCYVEDTEGYFDTVEISLMISMMSIIDNGRQDVPLLSLLYSPIFSFTTEELSCIRIHRKKVPYYEAFDDYAEEGEDVVLREKCQQVLLKIDEWRSMAHALSLSDLVWRLMWETGYYSYAGALPYGIRRQANLRALADKAKDAEGMGIYDLFGFLRYVEQTKEGKISVGQMKTISESDDVVRIMTVHKSKGLEYPVVIASQLDRKFNLKSRSAGIKMHKRAGFALTNVNREQHWKRNTLMQNVIGRMTRMEGIEEEKRILYVDFTRAKDRLYMIGAIDGYDGDERQYQYLDSDNIHSPLEFVMGALMDCKTIDRRVIEMDEISEKAYQSSEAKKQLSELIQKGHAFREETARRLSYEYPHEAETRLKYKYSVSELNAEGGVHREKAAPREDERKTYTAAQIGTITHKVMEYIRFDGTRPEDVVAELVKKNILTEEEAGAVNLQGIHSFMDSGIGKRIAASSMVKREKPFTYLTEKDGTEVMVQGVIDCFFEEDGELVLVDYKNSSVTRDEILKERYEKQIAIYADALAEITGKPVKERYLFLLKQGELMEI